MKQSCCLLLVLSTLTVAAEKQPLSRYQSIVDRQMFGPVPADFDPTKSPADVQRSSASAAQKELTKEQEQLQSSIVFSVINVTPEGDTAVGFTDNADAKAPKHYYLKVGETKDGWTVKEADAAAASMTVVKNDIEVSLKIGDNSAKGGATTKNGSAAAPAAATERRGGGLLGGSLRSRRMMRRQQDEAAKAAAAAAAEQKEAERQAQVAADKAEREAEREQQRQQLMAIQEELRKAREQRQKESAEEKNANNDAQ